MTAVFTTRRIALSVFALALLAAVPIAQAHRKPDPDKHALKVEKKLAHFKRGALLHLVFVNGAESTGTVGQLDAASFSFVNLETNSTETHHYVEVESIGKGSNAIGKDKPHHRRGRL